MSGRGGAARGRARGRGAARGLGRSTGPQGQRMGQGTLPGAPAVAASAARRRRGGNENTTPPSPPAAAAAATGAALARTVTLDIHDELRAFAGDLGPRPVGMLAPAPPDNYHLQDGESAPAGGWAVPGKISTLGLRPYTWDGAFHNGAWKVRVVILRSPSLAVTLMKNCVCRAVVEQANNEGAFETKARHEKDPPAGYVLLAEYPGFVRSRAQRVADELAIAADEAAKLAARAGRVQARAAERAREWALKDYEAASDEQVVEWSINIGNKGAHFPARGLHVLMEETIKFCADDPTDATTAALLRAYSRTKADETVRDVRRSIRVVVKCARAA